MALTIALAWLLVMLGLFAWLVWWDRSDGHEEQPPLRPLAAILDEAVAHALNGDEACERLLWETLAGYLSDYRDLRLILEYAREHRAYEHPAHLASPLPGGANREEGVDRELEAVAMELAPSGTTERRATPGGQAAPSAS